MVSSSEGSSDGSRSPSPLTQLFNNSKSRESSAGGRMLVTISWMGSIWEVRVVMSGQERVKGVIQAALAAFAKEEHRLPCGSNPDHYRLFSSPFSLQSLNADACLMDLGVRSFILRRNTDMQEAGE